MNMESWIIPGLYFILPALTVVAWFFISRAAKTPESRKRALRTLLFTSGLLFFAGFGAYFGIGSVTDSEESRRMGDALYLFGAGVLLVLGLILLIPRSTRLLGLFFAVAAGTFWLSYQVFDAVAQRLPWLRL